MLVLVVCFFIMVDGLNDVLEGKNISLGWRSGFEEDLY